MRIVHRDMKEGSIKVKPENLDDLWYLKGLVTSGDLVSGRSYRRIRDDEKLRADKGVRVPVFVEIRVENVEFAKYLSRLRITGKIEKGPEDLVTLGTYHTIEIEPNDVFTITKEKWLGWELDRLKEAEKATATPLVLITCIEEGEAEVVIVRKYGLDFAVRVTVGVPGKRVEKEHDVSAKQFYGEVASKIAEILKKEEIKTAVICGPGFAKDNLTAFLKEKYPDVAKVSFVESTGMSGRVGVQEVIKRGAVDRVVKDSRVSLETMLVERVFEEIGKSSGLVAYGLEEVKKALEYGAIEKLLISDVSLRKFKEVDKLIANTKNARGEAVIVSTEHEAGERLQGIGGIAALLRFKVA